MTDEYLVVVIPRDGQHGGSVTDALAEACGDQAFCGEEFLDEVQQSGAARIGADRDGAVELRFAGKGPGRRRA